MQNYSIINYLDCRYLQNCDDSWYCKECCSTIFPLTTYQAAKTSWLVILTQIAQWKDLQNHHNSSLSLKPSSKLKILVNKFSNATPDNGNDPEKIALSKLYDIDQMHNIEIS